MATIALPYPHRRSLFLAEAQAAARRAVIPFALSRLALIIVTIIAAHMSDVAPSGGPPQPTPTLHDMAWRWYFWDGANYTAIAQAGYARPERIAFFPLWPMLQRLGALGSDHVFYAGLILASACCFAACVLLEMLAPVRPGGLPVSAFLLASPFAFFLAAPMSESLFLLLAVGCLLALRRGEIGWAVACCALATATRSTGVALLAPILYVYLRRQGISWRSIAAAIPVALASLSGLLLFALYCLVTTGDALAFATAERMDYGRAFVWPWQTVTLAIAGILRSGARPLLDIVPVALAVLVLVCAWRRLPMEQTLFSLGALALVLCFPVVTDADPIVSGGRYMLMIAPLFLALHRWGARRPWLGWTLITLSVLVQVALATFELRHGWLP